LSKKIQSFNDYDFKTFTAELKKKKIVLKQLEQDDWEEYFDTHKEAINQLKGQISITDSEIDLRVYKLYGLTYEEVCIVEPGFVMSRVEYEAYTP